MSIGTRYIVVPSTKSGWFDVIDRKTRAIANSMPTRPAANHRCRALNRAEPTAPTRGERRDIESRIWAMETKAREREGPSPDEAEFVGIAQQAVAIP